MSETTMLLGEARRIAQVVASDKPFAVTAATVTIYDPTTSDPIVSDTADVDSTTEANEHILSYLWGANLDLAPGIPGDYPFRFLYTVGDQTLSARGVVNVFSPVDRYLHWMARIARWLRDAGDEAVGALSARQYQDAAHTAVRDYSQVKARRIVTIVDLANGTLDYPLPDEWQIGLSQLVTAEYPIDLGWPGRSYLCKEAVEVDESLGLMRFWGVPAQTGQSLRLTITAPHVLDHNADTVPVSDFDSVTQYAAGIALLTLANESAGSSSAAIGADSVQTRTKQQEYLAMGNRMIALARAAWQPGRPYLGRTEEDVRAWF